MHKEFKNPKIYVLKHSSICKRLSSICDECGSEDEKIFKEKESTEVLDVNVILI